MVKILCVEEAFPVGLVSSTHSKERPYKGCAYRR